jgi:hypothetical protein
VRIGDRALAVETRFTSAVPLIQTLATLLRHATMAVITDSRGRKNSFLGDIMEQTPMAT